MIGRKRLERKDVGRKLGARYGIYVYMYLAKMEYITVENVKTTIN